MDNNIVSTTTVDLLSQLQSERQKLDNIDNWARWAHDEPHKPNQATPEYKELAKRAQAPWGDLVVTSVAQTLYVEGYRRPDQPEDTDGWDHWQRNGFDARQIAIHKAALTYGYSFGVALPGLDPVTGASAPRLRGVSPREMIAVYDDPADDEWPIYALRCRARRGGGFKLVLFDAEAQHLFELSDISATPQHVKTIAHNAGVCPVVRYTNRLDLEGRIAGEVEPFIPLLGRIDQTSFDRLVVQRFASWVVRTVAGMDLEASAAQSNTTVETAKLLLKVNDILVSKDPDAKFGSLPATPLDGFIKAKESDLTDLSAVSQTPAFELLGQMANLSAEALAAAKASQTAKSDERKHLFGESHEQLIRLACHIAGQTDAAADFTAQVRWADTSIRSLSQAVDALGKMAQMLGFPPELLWQKVPGFTQQDVQEAQKRLDELGGLDSVMSQLIDGQTTPTLDPAADAVNV